MLDEYNREDNMYGFLMDPESKEIFFERRVNGARREGLRLGKEQGFKLGEKRGIEKTKLETAKSLLKNNIPYNIIQDVTGFNETYLKTIKL